MKSIILKKRWFKSNTCFTKKQKLQFEKFLQTKEKMLDKQGNNPLHLAVICNEVNYLEKALKLKALLEQKNDLGFTPLELAKMLGRQKCIDLIEPRKQNIIKLEKNGKVNKFTEQEYARFKKVKFIPHLRFENIAILTWVIKRCKKALKKGDITKEHKWLGSFYSKEIEQGYIPPITIKWISRVMGYGLFADQPFKKGAFIAEYVGHVRKYGQKMDHKNAYLFEYLIADKYDTPYVIDAKDEGNLARYINHDDQGNLTPVAVFHQGIMRVVLKANRAIKKGEQLCYDYGPEYWTKREDPKEL